MYIYIDLACFYDFSNEFWNCSYSVVFHVFHFIARHASNTYVSVYQSRSIRYHSRALFCE